MNMKLISKRLHDPYLILLLGMTILAGILRLYHFQGFVGFLGDQGRDAIVIRRIATLEDFPGIGPSSSVGNVFLGPFFYYFSAPWLLLFNFDPIGPAYGVALTSIVSIPLAYLALKKISDKTVALVFTFFMAVSYSMVWLSRFAWNPNLLPITSFFSMYFFIRARQTQKTWMYAVMGAFVSISIQMHYVALALGLPMGIYLLKDAYVRYRQHALVLYLQHIGASIVGFVLLQLPFIIFDIRNNFLNLRGFIGIFDGERGTGRPPLQEILYTFSQFIYHAFQVRILEFGAGIILIILCATAIYAYVKKMHTLVLIHVFFTCVLLLTSFFTNVKNLHYFGPLYPLMYLLVSYIIVEIARKVKMPLVLVLCLFGFLCAQRQLTMYFRFNGSYLIRRAEHISAKIHDNVTGDTVQITSLPDHYGDYMYRYYLEVWGQRPVERASLIKADELFVVCEEKCKPIGDPQWDIAYFQPTDIVGTWKVEDVTIYKLIRK